MENDQAWLHVETPGILKIRTTEICLSPEQSTTLTPMLALFNTIVSSVRVAKTGHLMIEFEEDRSMLVAPNEAYEAWQIACSTEKGELISEFEQPVIDDLQFLQSRGIEMGPAVSPPSSAVYAREVNFAGAMPRRKGLDDLIEESRRQKAVVIAIAAADFPKMT